MRTTLREIARLVDGRLSGNGDAVITGAATIRDSRPGDITLAEAREAARTQRKLIKQGIDPVQAKREQLAITKAANAVRMTFKQCVTGYLDSHGDGWRNAKHRQQWANTLETYAYPVIGDLDVSKVDTPHVMKIIEPIWKTKTETASRVRGRIESVLSWATVLSISVRACHVFTRCSMPCVRMHWMRSERP